MFSNYKPTWMVEAIYQITPAQLKNLGIKAVLTDLDNTLIAWNNPDGTEDSWVKGQDEWLHKNGLINPDGSPTQKEKDMEAQSENDDFGEDIPDEPDPE